LFFGIGIWYIVRYNDFELKKLANLLTGHAISAALIVSLWLGISGYIADVVIKEELYSIITGQLIPVRIIFGVLYYIVIVLVYYLLVYYQNFKEKLQYEATVETRYKEAELNALKSQINPHFIFNSLNSISSLTISDPAKAQEMIVKLSDFFRLTLKNENQHLTTLKNELNFSRLYFEIEKIRFGEKLEFRLNLPDSLEELYIPHLILQPILENAIKHGVQESLNQVLVTVTCSRVDDLLVLMVKNHFDRDLKVRGEGIGLRNVRERMKLIYGRTDLLQTETDNEKNEFTVTLRIPLIKPEDATI
jgi:LytS/YehU family sensor histidine kinase